MARVSLELLKKHVRADDFDDDDAYLEHVLAAAEEYVTGLTGYTADELSVIPDSAFPRPLAHAILMRAASMYEYREDVSTSIQAVPNSLIALVRPYQKMDGGSITERLIAKYKEAEADEVGTDD